MFEAGGLPVNRAVQKLESQHFSENMVKQKITIAKNVRYNFKLRTTLPRRNADVINVVLGQFQR